VVGGVVKDVASALVTHQGFNRQFWPSTLPADEPIVMTTDGGQSFAVGPVGSVVRAVCNYDARTASLIVSGFAPIPVLQPAPRGTGLYLLKCDIISGNLTAVGPEGSWFDVNSDTTVGVFEYYLQNSASNSGQLVGEMDVTVAEDDGGGSPQAGTEVTKRISFTAELTGSNFVFTTDPWSLEDIRINEIASCQITTIPSGLDNQGISAGYEGQVLAEAEVYAKNWNASFQVRLNEVSGSSITGAATGVWLASSERRDWFLQAPTDGDDFSAEVDLLVTDGISTVAKRITLHSKRGDEVASGSIDQEFTQFDVLQDLWYTGLPEPSEASLTLRAQPDGTIDVTNLAQSHNSNFPQKWFDGTPSDPENYECRLTLVENRNRGDLFVTGSAPLDQWLNLSSQRFWTYFADGSDLIPSEKDIHSAIWQLDIREVGRPDTVESKIMDVLVQADGASGGGPLP
jgi:hypothetical protein